MVHSKTVLGLAAIFSITGCGSSDPNPATGGSGGGSGMTSGGSGTTSGGSGATSSGGGSAGIAGGGSAGVGGSSAGASGSAGSGGAAGGTTLGTCTPPTDVFSPISTLSQTGCVDPTDPRKPIARAVAYELNSPLWSDSADKSRAFVLPSGAKIHVRNCVMNAGDCPMGAQDDGRWDFPVGTVMIKIFMFDSKLVETRLFMHVDAADWVGYSYQWDEMQTDAKIVTADRASVMFNTQTRTVPWHYPSQADCLTCHNAAAGFTLGPETAQMNRVVGGAGGMNQLDKFAAAGLFDAPLPMPYKKALDTPYPGQLGNPPAGASKTELARSYLHANCGFCHRPGGAFALFDLRYDTLLKDTNLCNVDINKAPPTGAPATKRMVPGDHLNSALWQRMNVADPDAGRMPQIASYLVDTAATGVVGSWIDSLTATDCTK